MDLDKKSILDINVRNKRVLIRTDFDVPVKNGKVVDNERIIAAFSTIKYALDHKCRSIILISHMGEPKGTRNERFSLRPIVAELNKLLATGYHTKVCFLEDLQASVLNRTCVFPPRGSVVLLENIRFYLEEISCLKDKKITSNRDMVRRFRQTLRRCADVYVNDTFRFSHLEHSSMVGQYFEARVAGLLVQKELKYFRKLLIIPRRPFVAIIGGDKFPSKLKVLDNLLNRADDIIVAGGLPFTFLKIMKNMQIGDSLFSHSSYQEIKKLMMKSNDYRAKVHLPEDFIVAHQHERSISLKSCTVEVGIPDGIVGLDIAPESICNFSHIIRRSRTILWHGPLGVVENNTYDEGTMCIMQAILETTKQGATSVILGEETIKFCKKWSPLHKYSHVSPGCAGIWLLQGKTLPA